MLTQTSNLSSSPDANEILDVFDAAVKVVNGNAAANAAHSDAPASGVLKELAEYPGYDQ